MTELDSRYIVSFRRFSELVQVIAETRGNKQKAVIFGDYLRSLPTGQHIGLAVRFAGEGAFSTVSGQRVSVGHRTVAVCAAAFCEIDYDQVFRDCRTATGSASEAIGKLMENLPAAVGKRKPGLLSLADIEALFGQLAQQRGREAKQILLANVWIQMTPLEIKYFIRIMGQGGLRIGFEARSIIPALAYAFNRDAGAVRYAHMITGNLGQTAELCLTDRLESARFQLFHPIAFMLASPIESRTVDDITAYMAEDKFDGMRCQLHVEWGKVALYSRDLNEITGSFPEVSAGFAAKMMPATVFDGELCVIRDNRIQSFQQLQKRMGVKKPAPRILEQYPVVFIAYDVLYADGKPQFGFALERRRQKLESLCEQWNIHCSEQFEIRGADDVERLFATALANSNEGLMLKRRGSPYEYGQRGKSWLKVKKPGGTLDTVIMYAHAGSGKRAGTYSDFTLGISVRDDERYREDFIPIGKAYGGYTNTELKKLNHAMKPLIVERFGPTYALKPGIVVELEFDGIQVNKRTKAGYTLRLPRFRAIRWDLGPADVDTLRDVERLAEAESAPENGGGIWMGST